MDAFEVLPCNRAKGLLRIHFDGEFKTNVANSQIGVPSGELLRRGVNNNVRNVYTKDTQLSLDYDSIVLHMPRFLKPAQKDTGGCATDLFPTFHQIVDIIDNVDLDAIQ